MSENSPKAYLSLIGAMLIVGSSVVIGKVVALRLPIFTALELRFLIALAAIWPILKRREGGLPSLTRRTWTLMLLQAAGGVLAFNVCLLYGLRLTDAASAGIITSATPAVMAVLAWVSLGDRPGPRVIAGIMAAVAGVMIINLSGTHGVSPDSRTLLGNGLVFGAVCGEAVFLLLRRKVREPVSALATSTIMTGLGAILFLPLAILETLDSGLSAFASPSAWLLLIYYGLGITVLAYILWFRGIVAVPASRAGVVTAVMPVTAVALSWLCLGEPLGLPQLLGCGLVLAAIGLTCGGRSA